jgi:hypothetical protein
VERTNEKEDRVQPYTEYFYKDQMEGARQSAQEIVPLVLALVQPRHVVDVGCGVGAWLSVFRDCGVEDVIGIDGEYVDKTMLQIPQEHFLAFDLKRPVWLGRQFDLVVSLEVAEHLPSESAEIFVDSLTRLGPIILFSAAIPFQGGTNHLNEQWPEYWAAYFQAHGYVAIDCIRKKVWTNEKVEWWYAQNILLFVQRDYVASHPLLQAEYEKTHSTQLSIVHPKKYLEALQLQLATQDIATLIPPEDPFIFVDHDMLRHIIAAGRPVFPFLERDGQYWGPPPDGQTAVRELTRLRQSGAKFVVFAWPAFWWLDHYAELSHHLHSEFRCLLQNERLMVFDLRSELEPCEKPVRTVSAI